MIGTILLQSVRDTLRCAERVAIGGWRGNRTLRTHRGPQDRASDDNSSARQGILWKGALGSAQVRCEQRSGLRNIMCMPSKENTPGTLEEFNNVAVTPQNARQSLRPRPARRRGASPQLPRGVFLLPQIPASNLYGRLRTSPVTSTQSQHSQASPQQEGNSGRIHRWLPERRPTSCCVTWLVDLPLSIFAARTAQDTVP